MVDISYLPGVGKMVRKAISDVIWSSSIFQTLQGIATAGPVRSIRYGFEKLKKKAAGTTEEPPVSVPAIVTSSSNLPTPKLKVLTPIEINELESLQQQKKEEQLRATILAREEAAEARARAQRQLSDEHPVTFRDLDLPRDPLPGLIPPTFEESKSHPDPPPHKHSHPPRKIHEPKPVSIKKSNITGSHQPQPAQRKITSPSTTTNKSE